MLLAAPGPGACGLREPRKWSQGRREPGPSRGPRAPLHSLGACVGFLRGLGRTGAIFIQPRLAARFLSEDSPPSLCWGQGGRSAGTGWAGVRLCCPQEDQGQTAHHAHTLQNTREPLPLVPWPGPWASL